MKKKNSNLSSVKEEKSKKAKKVVKKKRTLLRMDEVVNLSINAEKSKVRKLEKENLLLKSKILELQMALADRDLKLLNNVIISIDREHKNSSTLEKIYKSSIEEDLGVKGKPWGFDPETGEIDFELLGD